MLFHWVIPAKAGANELISREGLSFDRADPPPKKRVEADDPVQNRCGCFLPDLTKLATTPSADFRRAIWGRSHMYAS